MRSTSYSRRATFLACMYVVLICAMSMFSKIIITVPMYTTINIMESQLQENKDSQHFISYMTLHEYGKRRFRPITVPLPPPLRVYPLHKNKFAPTFTSSPPRSFKSFLCGIPTTGKKHDRRDKNCITRGDVLHITPPRVQVFSHY